jgi:hypothetical protein
MKAKVLFAATGISAAFLFSCSNDDAIDAGAVGNTLKSGMWEVTYFFDSGDDETDNYSGYYLTFSQIGEVFAANGVDTVNGAWSTSTDSDGDVDLNLSFEDSPLFDDLIEDWHVVEHTGTKVRLDHVSGGGGGTDFLTLEKQ